MADDEMETLRWMARLRPTEVSPAVADAAAWAVAEIERLRGGNAELISLLKAAKAAAGDDGCGNILTALPDDVAWLKAERAKWVGIAAQVGAAGAEAQLNRLDIDSAAGLMGNAAKESSHVLAVSRWREILSLRADLQRHRNVLAKGISGLLGDYSGEPVPDLDDLVGLDTALRRMVERMRQERDEARLEAERYRHTSDKQTVAWRARATAAEERVKELETTGVNSPMNKLVREMHARWAKVCEQRDAALTRANDAEERVQRLEGLLREGRALLDRAGAYTLHAKYRCGGVEAHNPCECGLSEWLADDETHEKATDAALSVPSQEGEGECG